VTKQEKENYKKQLIEKKKEIVAHLSEFKSDSLAIETGDVQDMGDKAESSYTKEFLLSLSDAQRTRLDAIDEALKRIEGDDFGTCEDCGKKIPKKRLNVLPWTPHCIDCQEKEEQAS
jgi:DnaK suppressor protein